MPAFDFDFSRLTLSESKERYRAIELCIGGSYFSADALKNLMVSCKDLNRAVKDAMRRRLGKAIVERSIMHEVQVVFPDCVNPQTGVGVGLSAMIIGTGFSLAQTGGTGRCTASLDVHLHGSGRILVNLALHLDERTRWTAALEFTPRSARSGTVELKERAWISGRAVFRMVGGVIGYTGGSPFQIVARWFALPWSADGRFDFGTVDRIAWRPADDVCPVCLSRDAGIPWVTLARCRHSFHAACVAAVMLHRIVLCPLCRGEMI